MTGASAKILIVDDTPANIQMLDEVLQTEFDVYFALNGTEALQKVESLKPDLILLDIMMPLMDGFEVCRQLKVKEQFKNIPIIFITALGQPEDESRGLKLGAADYITKPFNPDLVLLRVRNHLELKNQRDVLEQRTIELDKALAEIKVLKGIIPICSRCKKIRDDQGYWQQLEVFIKDHSEAEFSHGICPGCMNEPEVGLSTTDREMQPLFHVLEVQRVELEMQSDELRQARDEVEKSLEKYSDLYDFAPVGYFTLDGMGIITSVNLRGASMVGIARPRLLGRNFEMLVSDEHCTIFTEFIRSVFLSRDKLVSEVAIKSTENHPVIVQLEAMAAISGQECGLVLIDITERKQLESDLRDYARRLTEIEEELRGKIATELHDEICRDLTVLGMNMAILSEGVKGVVSKRLTDRVRVSKKIIKSISHTVRNIMAGLRPPILDDFGLLATLRWHADLFSKRSNIAAVFEADEPFPRLPAEQETTLFRISQEALMNIAKHADAQIVTIQLRKAGGMVQFSVSDDGKGFSPREPSHTQNSSGWGMKIMRERAELIGGTFQVESVPGKGTTVSVVIPLEDV